MDLIERVRASVRATWLNHRKSSTALIIAAATVTAFFLGNFANALGLVAWFQRPRVWCSFAFLNQGPRAPEVAHVHWRNTGQRAAKGVRVLINSIAYGVTYISPDTLSLATPTSTSVPTIRPVTLEHSKTRSVSLSQDFLYRDESVSVFVLLDPVGGSPFYSGGGVNLRLSVAVTYEDRKVSCSERPKEDVIFRMWSRR
jgi:hypothetical protein